MTLGSAGTDPTQPEAAQAAARALQRTDALAPGDVAAPNWPVAIALMEAEALLGFLHQAPDILRRLRSAQPAFDPALDLRAAVDLLRERQVAWLQITTKRKPEEQADLEARGEQLRAEVLAALRWLMRADVQARDFIAQVQDGAGLADLIQDLDVLAAFLSERADQLTDDEFDPHAHAQQAATLAEQLRAGFVAAAAPDGREGLRDLRDRAWTYLAAVMSEIRTAAAFRFRQDPDLLAARFTSAYARRRNQRSRASKATP